MCWVAEIPRNFSVFGHAQFFVAFATCQTSESACQTSESDQSESTFPILIWTIVLPHCSILEAADEADVAAAPEAAAAAVAAAAAAMGGVL